MELPHLDSGILDADGRHHVEAWQKMKMVATLNPNDADPHQAPTRLFKAMGRIEEAKVEFR